VDQVVEDQVVKHQRLVQQVQLTQVEVVEELELLQHPLQDQPAVQESLS
jgi:hypothetical protein